MSERYVVELEFKRLNDGGLGDLGAKAKKLEGGFDSFKKGWNGFSESVAPVGAAVDSVVGKVANLAKYAVLGGGAMIFAGAAYGVTGLNNELEKTEISLGAIFAANGVASNVPSGIKTAHGLIQQMRRDAQTLPGEFEDLQRIFTTSAVPAFNSGASVDQLRNLSAKVMAAGKVASLDMHMVAREFAQLLGGRAGSHNVLGSTLMGLHGKEATKFNALASDKRLAFIEKELDKYSGAVSAFGDSFDAQSSTLADNLKQYARVGTSSLFVHVKDTMREANDWFSSHQAEADAFAAVWGSRLVDGFEAGKRVVTEYGPLLVDFADGAYKKFTAVWVDVQPYVSKFEATLKSALADPNGTIDKLIELGKIWAGLKIGGMLIGGAGDAMASGKDWKSGAASIAGRGGALLGAYGIADAAMNGPSMASFGETTAGGALLGARGGPLTAAVGAATGSLVGLSQVFMARAAAEDENNARIFEGTDAIIAHYQGLGVGAAYVTTALQSQADALRAAGDDTAAALMEKAAEIRMIDFSLESYARRRDDEMGSFWGDVLRLSTQYRGNQAAAVTDKKAEAHKSKGGGGGTVQKVEIVITSNQHPNRIARGVVGYMSKLARNPTASPHVTNFGALEES